MRKLQVTGRAGASYMLTIPKRYIKELNWQENQKVLVKKSGKKLIISDWKG